MPNEQPIDSGDPAATGNARATMETAETVPPPESPIRVGSPFAEDPFAHDPTRPIEILYDAGPVKYTALGAVAASILVIGFAATAAYFFPAGGTMIAALGCLLSVFGMYSAYRLTAAGLLAIHLCLFVLSYARTFG